MTALFSGMALSPIAVRFLIVSLWSFFAAVASPRFAVNFFMVVCSSGSCVATFAFIYRGGIATLGGHPPHDGAIFRDGIVTDRGPLLHCGASLLRWHPHGSRSTSSWWRVSGDGIPSVHGQPCVPCCFFIVMLLVAAIFNGRGIPAVCAQLLAGTFSPQWYPHSRVEGVCRFLIAVNFVVATLYARSAIPTVCGHFRCSQGYSKGSQSTSFISTDRGQCHCDAIFSSPLFSYSLCPSLGWRLQSLVVAVSFLMAALFSPRSGIPWLNGWRSASSWQRFCHSGIAMVWGQLLCQYLIAVVFPWFVAALCGAVFWRSTSSFFIL